MAHTINVLPPNDQDFAIFQQGRSMEGTGIGHRASVTPCPCLRIIQFCDGNATHITAPGDEDLIITQHGRGVASTSKVHALCGTPYPGTGIVHFCGRDTSYSVASLTTCHQHPTTVQQCRRMLVTQLTHTTSETPCSCIGIVDFRRCSMCHVVSIATSDEDFAIAQQRGSV